VYKFFEPLLDPAFREFVIDAGLGIPRPVPPGKEVTLHKVHYLTEGNPTEVERLARQSKVLIRWEEGDERWEKIVDVAGYLPYNPGRIGNDFGEARDTTSERQNDGPVREVRVVPYDPAWPRQFLEEAERLRAVFGRELVDIHHIGSTSVPGLAAKPIIDILPVVRDIGVVDRFNGAM